jgi:hypothetical protein
MGLHTHELALVNLRIERFDQTKALRGVVGVSHQYAQRVECVAQAAWSDA